MALSSKKNIDKKKDTKPPTKAQSEGAKAIKGLRVNYLIIFLSGLVILIAAILTYLLIYRLCVPACALLYLWLYF